MADTGSPLSDLTADTGGLAESDILYAVVGGNSRKVSKAVLFNNVYTPTLGFTSDFDGLYRGDTDALSTAWTIGASGQLIFDSPINRIWYGFTRYVRDRAAVYEYVVEASCDAATINSGAMLVVGEGAAMQIYSYTKDGAVTILGKDNVADLTLESANPLLVFATDEKVKLRLVVGPDDSGFVEIISGQGYSKKYEVSAVPTGKVGIAVRDDEVTTVWGFTAQQLETDLAGLIERDRRAGGYGPILQSTTVLPALPGGAASGGFTATGIDRISRGQWANCWLIASDGREVEGDTGFNPQVAVVAPDFGAILQVFTLSGNTSVQGVAVDTLDTGADSFWAALITNGGSYTGDIRHYKLYDTGYTNFGTTANIPREDTGDVINFQTDYGVTPNGLAFDTGNAALWCGAGNFSNVIRLISRDPLASPRLLDTGTVNQLPDQMHYDNINKNLYYTDGDNGTNGVVYAYRISDEASAIVYDNLERSQAIEGVYIDRGTADMFIVNDGGFHNTAEPALNAVMRYKINLFS